MTRHLLVTRPEYDYTTRYVSVWSEQYFKLAEQKGYTIIDLKKERANRHEFESILKKKNPELVVLNGHGNSDQIAGQDDEIIIETNSNSNLLIGKITYALSCQSAKELGEKIGLNPDTSYIGYKEDFAFLRLEKNGRKPIEDKLAGFFFEPSNSIVVSLLKGHTTGDSLSKGKQEFYKNIQKLLTSKVSPDDYSALRLLVWDLKHLTLCGDKNKSLV